MAVSQAGPVIIPIHPGHGIGPHGPDVPNPTMQPTYFPPSGIGSLHSYSNMSMNNSTSSMQITSNYGAVAAVVMGAIVGALVLFLPLYMLIQYPDYNPLNKLAYSLDWQEKKMDCLACSAAGNTEEDNVNPYPQQEESDDVENIKTFDVFYGSGGGDSLVDGVWSSNHSQLSNHSALMLSVDEIEDLVEEERMDAASLNSLDSKMKDDMLAYDNMNNIEVMSSSDARTSGTFRFLDLFSSINLFGRGDHEDKLPVSVTDIVCDSTVEQTNESIADVVVMEGDQVSMKKKKKPSNSLLGPEETLQAGSSTSNHSHSTTNSSHARDEYNMLPSSIHSIDTDDLHGSYHHGQHSRSSSKSSEINLLSANNVNSTHSLDTHSSFESAMDSNEEDSRGESGLDTYPYPLMAANEKKKDSVVSSLSTSSISSVSIQADRMRGKSVDSVMSEEGEQHLITQSNGTTQQTNYSTKSFDSRDSCTRLFATTSTHESDYDPHGNKVVEVVVEQNKASSVPPNTAATMSEKSTEDTVASPGPTLKDKLVINKMISYYSTLAVTAEEDED